MPYKIYKLDFSREKLERGPGFEPWLIMGNNK